MYDEKYVNPLERGRLYMKCKPYLNVDFSEGYPAKITFKPGTPKEIMDAWAECEKYSENIALFIQETGEYIN